MTKFDLLGIAEDVVRAAGSYPMFQEQYTTARQFYDIETSVEMALEQQGLVDAWVKAVRVAQEDQWAQQQPNA